MVLCTLDSVCCCGEWCVLFVVVSFRGTSRSPRDRKLLKWSFRSLYTVWRYWTQKPRSRLVSSSWDAHDGCDFTHDKPNSDSMATLKHSEREVGRSPPHTWRDTTVKRSLAENEMCSDIYCSWNTSDTIISLQYWFTSYETCHYIPTTHLSSVRSWREIQKERIVVWLDWDDMKYMYKQWSLSLSLFQEIQHNCQLHRMSFCADDKTDKRIFTFICTEPETKKHLCYVFDSEKCVSERDYIRYINIWQTSQTCADVTQAEEITLAIGQAFDLAYKKFLESGGKDVETRKQIGNLQKRVRSRDVDCHMHDHRKWCHKAVLSRLIVFMLHLIHHSKGFASNTIRFRFAHFINLSSSYSSQMSFTYHTKNIMSCTLVIYCNVLAHFLRVYCSIVCSIL